MQRNFLILLLPPLLLLALSSAHAAGIQVSPSKLGLHALFSAQTSAELTVTNPTSDVQLFEVYPDDFADLLKVSPSNFTLPARGSKTTTVSLQSDQKLTDTLKTNLSIVAKPLAGGAFQANSGVKIPLTITFPPLPAATNTTVYRYLLFGCIVAALVSFGAVYVLRKRKQRLMPNSIVVVPSEPSKQSSSPVSHG